MGKSLSFPRPTSQVLAIRKKEAQEERSRPEKKSILQDLSPADLLLQDPAHPSIFPYPCLHGPDSAGTGSGILSPYGTREKQEET